MGQRIHLRDKLPYENSKHTVVLAEPLVGIQLHTSRQQAGTLRYTAPWCLPRVLQPGQIE